MKLPPLSLYVHIPWCVRKCPYCDFNSHVAGKNLPEQAYVDALMADLSHCVLRAQGRELHSIFFGGGTPSLFSATAIGQIIEAAQNLIGFTPAIEITLEANPGTFEQARFADYRRAGVNRLSIGVQSFNAAQLNALGRIHSDSEASLAIRCAQDVGFDNINIDLMHGLPDQTTAQAMADLAQANALQPSHISWYQLTIEKNTPFYSRPPTLPNIDVLAEIEDEGFAMLAAAGWQRYEISAFAQHNQFSQHNLNYWQFGDYLGIGAGAHGKITDLNSGEVKRSQVTRMPQHYLTQIAPNFNWRTVARDQLPFEFMMNALRLKDGVSIELFAERTGIALTEIDANCGELVKKELLQYDNKTIRCTDTGYQFFNDVVGAFL